MSQQTNVMIYQGQDGALELKGDFSNETIWATLDQIAHLFGRDKSVISRHIRNIFQDEELDKKVVVAKNAMTTRHGAMENKTQTKEVSFYNLDMILSIGYRVNSKVATRFRQWATKTLSQHITDGYTINPARLQNNYQQFLQTVEEVKALVADSARLGAGDALEIVKAFASTWFSLDAYDKSEFPVEGYNKEGVEFTALELAGAIAQLKADLMAKGQASELFAQEKGTGKLEGIIGSIFQSTFGMDAYSNVEEKAAHLLYFIIKNHPFTDGNKRSAAFSFVWFLRKAGVLQHQYISPETLTALTLLIAESDPKDKQRMIGIVLLLLRKQSW